MICELARRQTADVKRIRAVRGLERRAIQRHLAELSEAIKKALALPENELPRRTKPAHKPQMATLVQLLNCALSSICRAAQIAPAVVGTVEDVRELATYWLKPSRGSQVPALAQGWRAEVVGNVLEELIDGKLSISVTDPLSEHPLSFQRVEPLA